MTSQAEQEAQTSAPVSGGHDLEIHKSMRSLGGTLAELLLGFFLAISPMVPFVRDRLDVPLWLTASISGLFTVVVLVSTYTFRRFGRNSRIYDVFNKLETAVSVGSSMAYVYWSHNAVSFFWLIYFGILFHASTSGSNRLFNGSVMLGFPLLLALAFAVLRDDLGAAGLALLAGLLGGVIYIFVSKAMRQLALVQEERSRLQAQVAELQVHRERARIARDLHDGLGAELAALMWRARSLQDDVSDPALRSELGVFMERVRQGTDELRNIVFALRADGQPWPEVVAHLRTRGLELCAGGVEFQLHDDGNGASLILPGELALHVVRMCQEAIRNAVRHGRPSRVTVSVGCLDHISILVQDDGQGLPEGALEKSVGGLKNIRQRASTVGGTAHVESSSQGTSIRLDLPVPAAA